MTLAINKNDEKKQSKIKREGAMKLVYSHFIALNSSQVAVVTAGRYL